MCRGHRRRPRVGFRYYVEVSGRSGVTEQIGGQARHRLRTWLQLMCCALIPRTSVLNFRERERTRVGLNKFIGVNEITNWIIVL